MTANEMRRRAATRATTAGSLRWLAVSATLATGLLVALATGPAAAARPSALRPADRPAVTVAPQPSAGCQSAAALPAGAQTPAGSAPQPITVGTRSGIYLLQVPTTYKPGTPMPVIFDMHGYFETAQIQVNISALGPYGQTHGFITVTPQVTEPVPLWLSVPGTVDLKFFGGLLDHIEQTVCVDQKRVFVTGYSNGAFMSSAIACQFAGRVAAVAPVAGIQDFRSLCKPSRPVPVVAFHGTADPFVHFNGTPSKAAANLPAPNGDGSTLGKSAPALVKTNGESIPAVTAAWAKRNRCGPHPATTSVATGVTRIRYACPNHADVELYVVKGGGHAWPGSVGSRTIGKIVGFTTFAISADSIMWAFFQAHPLTSTN